MLAQAQDQTHTADSLVAAAKARLDELNANPSDATSDEHAFLKDNHDNPDALADAYGVKLGQSPPTPSATFTPDERHAQAVEDHANGSGWYHIYFDKYYCGRILGHHDGWRVSFQNEGKLGEFSTVDEAKRAVFEWFALNYPRG